VSVTEAAWIAWVAVHFLVGSVGTWLARSYALRHRLIDQPGERRAHTVATPRGGGIAIVAALLVAIAWLSWQGLGTSEFLGPYAAGLILVAGVGWVDDHRPLSPWLRLLVHVVAAGALAWGAHRAGAPPAVVVAGFGLALVLVNIWNFMDGIDGLAASQALLVALACAAIGGAGAPVWLGAALAAACAGFLPFNLPKARIFLGDVGSGALGYSLAGLVVLATPQEHPERVMLLLLPLSAFLVDASLTLGSRILRGERWWLPHAEHAYQCWTRRTGRHGVVTLAYAAWTATATGVMLTVERVAPAFMMLTLVGTYMVGTVTWMRLLAPSRRWGTKE
jgi:UDP-N-acetylmuramyl pentapeptide phosphotransferase/UDP-N-acetylglucosamine-1-phosphate transferase